MQTLRIGDTGAEVALLQKGLNRAGASLVTDGIFGPATERAVRAFQGRQGLTADGIAGPLTERALAPWYRGYAIHTIRRGDTLWRLAARYDTTLLALETANPALDPFDLRIGQSIVVPFSFPVVPTDIPYSSSLVAYCVQGLAARYPFIQTETIGKSVLGLPIYAITLGEGTRRVIYNAEHHANEWITVPLLLRYTEELAYAAAAGERVFGYTAEEILFQSRITLIPAVNPDGLDLINGVLRGAVYDRAEAIAADYPAIPFPDGWKANIRGVDLNLQYPAEWERAREIKFSQGFISPAPRDYVGTAPLTEPESVALYTYTRRENPALILAYHTQGEVIYWKYLDREPEGSRALAQRFAAVSGYTYEETPYASGFAGYKDWFIQDFDRPGYTIEAGAGENPLPLSQFDSIYAANRGILTLAAIG